MEVYSTTQRRVPWNSVFTLLLASAGLAGLAGCAHLGGGTSGFRLPSSDLAPDSLIAIVNRQALATGSEAYLKTAWRNVLVGSLGSGGKGIYALDVTKLDELGTNSVLWDKTLPAAASDELHVGHIVTAPQVGVLPNGQWKVFVGNGYDSRSGQAALLIYSMVDGSLESIPVGSGDNGLGGLVLLRNSKQEVVGAYAGDLQGNLWRFEYDAKSGRMARGYGGNTLPLYTAKSSTGAPQPITATPAVVPHPSGGNVIVFGTGKLLETTDRSNPRYRQTL